MYFTLKNGVDKFQGRFSHLLQSIKLHDEPSSEHDEIVLHTLTTISSIAKDIQLRDSLVKREYRAFSVKTLELLVFMMFRKAVGRPRSIKQYANDFAELRQYLYAERNGKFSLGKDAFQTGMRFVEQRLEDENLAPLGRPFVQNIDSDSDELKQEEYERDEHSLSPSAPQLKRHRMERVSSRPTARRGGKFTGGPARK